MRNRTTRPVAANTDRSPTPAPVVPFPADLYTRARLHHRRIRTDASDFWEQVREGYAVAVKGAGAMDAIWVRDSERWAAAARQFNDLPVLIAGELRVVI